ncbi:hypothetical protein [Asanoa siamensis]|uniref:Choice-of-anchor D domain-containing protein n=1 Tax=Asanoa siamensis TaxID=926357 RepID=A0ABQ4CNK9_9ACTN|nr:hypothetical protein [Asanoa siamensis]GIF72412.1 hypothetical protein Asi02nite_19300 [Asanoa siamensis]
MRILRGAFVVATATAMIAALPAAAPAADKLDGQRLAVQLAATLSATPASLNFGPSDPGVDGPPLKVTIRANGSDPVPLGTPALGGTTPDAFTISGSTCTGVTLAAGQACDITVTPHATGTGAQSASLLVPNNGVTDPLTVPLSLTGQVTARGTFYPLPPTRVLDTRSGFGAPAAPIGPGRAIALQVTGNGGVPTTGVSAVVLNVTVTEPTRPSYLTVYPTGVPVRPTSSSLNFPSGWTGANSVTVAVGTGGKVDIFNAQGSTHVVADVAGYFATQSHAGPIGGALQAIEPTRLLDTRIHLGGPLPANYYINVPLSFGSEIDAHIRAFAVNVTAVRPSRTGFLTAWNGLEVDFPSTSTLNYTPNTVVPNMAIVPVAPCIDCGTAEGWPSIGVYTSATSDVLVDVVGVFDDSGLTGGLRFTPTTPTRVVDSRVALGVPGTLGPATRVTATPPSTVVTPDTAALALNVTAVNPTRNTFLSVWPAGFEMPEVSNLNPAAGQTVPNAVITLLGDNQGFHIYNSAGSTDVLADVLGRYWVYPDPATARGAPEVDLGSPRVFTGSAPRRLG